MKCKIKNVPNGNGILLGKEPEPVTNSTHIEAKTDKIRVSKFCYVFIIFIRNVIVLKPRAYKGGGGERCPL